MKQLKLTTMQASHNKMISNAYEKADFQIIEFSIEDALTASKVVHTTEATTSAPTTLPGTTAPSSGNISGGSGDAVFDFSDIFP